VSRHHHRTPPATPHPKASTRRRWRNKRDHVLRRLDADPTITHTGRNVAHAIAQYSDSAAKPCWPAQTTLAGRLGVVPRTVQRGITELEEAGYVAVRRHRPRYDAGRHGFSRQTNCYTLCMPKGTVEDYRPCQRRRYRSEVWKAREAAWRAAHEPLLLGDTGDALSPSGGDHPGATPPGCGNPQSSRDQEGAGNPAPGSAACPSEARTTGASPPGVDAGGEGVGLTGNGETNGADSEAEPGGAASPETARAALAQAKAALLRHGISRGLAAPGHSPVPETPSKQRRAGAEATPLPHSGGDEGQPTASTDAAGADGDAGDDAGEVSAEAARAAIAKAKAGLRPNGW